MHDNLLYLRKRVEDLEAYDPQSVQGRFSPEVRVLGKAIEGTLAAVFGPGTLEYNRYLGAARLDPGEMSISFGGGSEPISQVRQDFEEGKRAAIRLLGQAIRGLEEEIAEHEYAAPPAPLARAKRPSRKVFVVHGHDDAALHAVSRFLEKLGLEAVILREQPDQGRTIIEKFEACADEVGFAVVLLTPDDIGSAAAAPQQASRARQNALFEQGYFAGKLGRGKACLLRKGDVEIPSDLYGVIYTELDPAEGWQLKLVKELKAAGLDFDPRKLWD